MAILLTPPSFALRCHDAASNQASFQPKDLIKFRALKTEPCTPPSPAPQAAGHSGITKIIPGCNFVGSGKVALFASAIFGHCPEFR